MRAQRVALGLRCCGPVSVKAYFRFGLKRKAHIALWRENICTVYLYVCVHKFIVFII